MGSTGSKGQGRPLPDSRCILGYLEYLEHHVGLAHRCILYGLKNLVYLIDPEVKKKIKCLVQLVHSLSKNFMKETGTSKDTQILYNDKFIARKL